MVSSMATDGLADPADGPTSGGAAGLVERRFPRSFVELPCLYSRDSGPDCDGTVFDVSRDGCAIRNTVHVQRSDSIQLSIFPSPNQSPIEISLAVVRWSTTAQFGVEFMMLSPRDTKRLRDYLALLDETR
jgi:hypothetical protein